MREIRASEIEAAVARLFGEANRELPPALESAITDAAARETCETARAVFGDMQANLAAARELGLPICQDTGMAVVFAELGQDVHIDGDFYEAVNRGVARAYRDGALRCSVVSDPLRRVNTGDNTPAVVHLTLVPGDRLNLTAAPKGFGSENMSRLKMMTPAATAEDVIKYVTDCVREAGSNPCPPVVIGVGIGSDFEGVALLAKRALCRDGANPDPYYAEMETAMLTAVNALGVGPQGFGGDCTALAVHIEAAPTHIAGLPVAVNVGCHVTRHKSITL